MLGNEYFSPKSAFFDTVENEPSKILVALRKFGNIWQTISTFDKNSTEHSLFGANIHFFSRRLSPPPFELGRMRSHSDPPEPPDGAFADGERERANSDPPDMSQASKSNMR